VSLALIRYEPPPTKVLAHRLLLLAELRESLAQLEADRDKLQHQLREFEKRFRPAVGDRYDQLEKLREQIRRAWAEVNRARNGSLEPADEAIPDEVPQEAFKPADELKNMFRLLARKIHPDLADDYDDRRHRHEFMAQATSAYRAADYRRLQWLLEHWEAAPSLPNGFDQASRLARTSQQIAWVRYRIREVNADIAKCGASSSMRLMEQSSEARSNGRNLVIEMRNQVIKEIDEAERDLRKVQAVLGDFDEETIRIIRANAGLDD
jgi:hypothetical protein